MNMQSPKSNKLNNIEAANRLRHGSPQFKAVLRQRCRKQMQERRDKLFNARRIGLDDKDECIENTLTEIVRREFSNMSSMLNESSDSLAEMMTWPDNQEELMSIEEQMIKDEEEWIIEEFNRMHQYEMDMMDKYLEEIMKNELVCPMCEKGTITQLNDFFVCPKCQLSLPAKVTMDDFYQRVKNHSVDHAESCNLKPCFMVIPEQNSYSLYMGCEPCSYFGLIL
ncbi:RPA-interacting protein B [Cotesia typhae]|uniref:RPA-interacting protein B n=1 Tax=Cotesia typhae TaxID=2053667 RepID=UPI003D6958AA